MNALIVDCDVPRPATKAVAARLAEAGQGVLGECSSRDVLEALNLPFPRQRVVTSADEAAAAAGALAGDDASVVLKVVSDAIVHKSDLGLVLVGVNGEQAVRRAYRVIRERCADAGAGDASIAVQEMAAPGIDLFVGLDRDETFGPVVIVGFGGTAVELDRDVAHRCLPVDTATVIDMLASLRRFPLLDGWRGGPRYRLDGFARIAETVSRLGEDVPTLTELDMNPVRVFADREALVLDARLRTAPVVEAGSAAEAPSAASMRALFAPASVAVIGASRDSARPGGRLVANLTRHGYAGRVFPINRSATEICGHRAYPSLAALPDVPDLVCVAVTASATVEAAAEAAAAGVPAVIAVASGFSESGPAGAELELQLLEAVGDSTVLCGPNTIGLASARNRVAATFTQALEGPELIPGRVAFISQSGAVGGSLIARELVAGYGFSYWVTVGNEAQVSVSDYLSFFAADDHVGAVAIFLEGVRDGAKFRRALELARTRDIPVVVFKTGTSTEGARAVASHSGALAGKAEVYASVLASSGAVLVDQMTALFEVAHVVAGRRPTSRGVAVVSTSGGAGSVVTDLAVSAGLRLPAFASATRTALTASLPPLAQIRNPLDVTAEGAFAPGATEASVAAAASDEGVGAVCVVLTSLVGTAAERVGAEIARAAAATEKPVLVTWLVDPSLATAGRARLIGAGIRVFEDPARMVQALVHAVRIQTSGDSLLKVGTNASTAKTDGAWAT